jgi:hypothetical protein
MWAHEPTLLTNLTHWRDKPVLRPLKLIGIKLLISMSSTNLIRFNRNKKYFNIIFKLKKDNLIINIFLIG